MSPANAFALCLALSATCIGADAVGAAGTVNAANEAAAISQVAMAKAKEGDFKLCAELYRQAYRTNPAFLGYLYSAARCAQKGGDLDSAERDYRSLLARAPADDPLVPRARLHVEDVLKARRSAPAPVAAPAPVVPTPAPSPAQVVPLPAAASETAQPAPAWRRPAGWAGIVIGASATALGAWWLVQGWEQRSDLKERLDARTDGLVVGLTPDQAHADEKAYRATLQRGALFAAGGLLVGGVGAWLMATAPTPVAVTVLPAPDGLLLQLAWR